MLRPDSGCSGVSVLGVAKVQRFPIPLISLCRRQSSFVSQTRQSRQLRCLLLHLILPYLDDSLAGPHHFHKHLFG